MGIAGLAEYPVQLDVGADSGTDAAKDLEDRITFEDHAGVALLGIRHPRMSVHRQRDVRLLAEPHVAPGRRGVDQGQQERRGARFVQGVVADAVAVVTDGGDGAVLGGRLGIPADDHLVPLGRTVGVGDVHQNQIEIVAQGHDVTRLGGRQLSAAPGVPALLGQPFRPGQIHCDSSDPRNWNQ